MLCKEACCQCRSKHFSTSDMKPSLKHSSGTALIYSRVLPLSTFIFCFCKFSRLQDFKNRASRVDLDILGFLHAQGHRKSRAGDVMQRPGATVQLASSLAEGSCSLEFSSVGPLKPASPDSKNPQSPQERSATPNTANPRQRDPKPWTGKCQ